MTVSKQERRAFLESVELFSGLPAALLDRIVDLSATKRLKADDVLCHKGDEAGQLYGVLSGRLKAIGTSSEGKELVYLVMGKGAVTGEIALLDGRPRSATIVAMEGSELLTLTRRDFLSLLRENPEASMHLCQVLAGYIRRLSDTVEDAYYHKLPVRLAKSLLGLARVHGVEHPDGIQIGVKLSQQEIGELVGKTREAINKQLRIWSDEGIVSTVDGHIIIRDMDALGQVAGIVVV
jgi:CRP/FNR family cyclic AMP-dependent transcriptional regulator